MRTFMGYNRTTCNCEECTKNCRYIPGYLVSVREFEDIGDWLNWDGHGEAEIFLKKYFRASPGALVSRGDFIFRIPTIVPARQENGWCIFFDGKRCKIHPVAPFACAFFDMHQNSLVSERLAREGIVQVLIEWEDQFQSSYCGFWNVLYGEGLTVSSPEESRKHMAEEEDNGKI
jgi:Fe-S-cluster containining protein